MAEDMQRLVVALEARTKAFENALNKANGVANKRAKAIESRFMAMNGKLDKSFTAMGTKIAGAFAVAGGLRGAQQLLDTSTRIQNALKVTGLSGEELTKVYDRLFASAQKNATPLESLVTLYGRVALVQDELGISQQQLEQFTDKVGVALRVAGTDAQTASGALLQLSQALGAGTVRAEEFSSMQEGALPILQAVATGLDEAGGSVAKLRTLVVDGKVSSQAFFRAFEVGSTILEEKVANSTFTVAQGFDLVRNSLIDAAGRMDDGSEASKKLSGALGTLAEAISSFDVSVVSNELAAMGRDFARTADDITRWANAYGRVKAALGSGDWKGALEASRGFLMPSEGPSNVRVAGGKGGRPVIGSSGVAGTGSVDHLLGAPGNVSTADHPTTGSKSASDKKSRRNEWERETAQIKERTAALQAETAAMAGLNPLIDDYGFALEKARAVAELENAALAAKIKITPEVKASIESLATSYAQATVDAERLAESQELIRERAQDMADLGKDVFGGFISDLRSGTSAAEALNNALGRIADTMINNVLDAIFQVNGAGGGGGILGSIFSGLFGGGGGGSFGTAGGFASMLGMDKGGYTGPGGKKQPAGVVHKGEVVFSQDDVRRHGGVGAVEAMRLRGFSTGGIVGPSVSSMAAGGNSGGQQSMHITVGWSRSADGNLKPFVEDVSRGQAQQVTANGLKAYDKSKQRQRMTAG